MTDDIRTYAQGEAVIRVKRTWCKGCNLCVEACPTGVLALDERLLAHVTNVDACIFCGICAERCPDFCISIQRPTLKESA